MEMGFKTEINYPVLCGKSELGKFELFYGDCSFEFYAIRDNGKFVAHFHLQSVEEAEKTVVDFMNGKLTLYSLDNRTIFESVCTLVKTDNSDDSDNTLNLRYIYDQLKDKYDLELATGLALDAGFGWDAEALTGKSFLTAPFTQGSLRRTRASAKI